MIPKEINILGIPHTVKACEDGFSLGDKSLGEIDYSKAEIRINKDMPDVLQMQTLVHEWVHGALVLLGFNEESNNEQFVQALSVAICQTFQLKGGKDG